LRLRRKVVSATGATLVAPRAPWCRKKAPAACAGRAGVLPCAVRLSRLQEQPLTPPDMNDALRRSVDDREKPSFASGFELGARSSIFDRVKREYLGGGDAVAQENGWTAGGLSGGGVCRLSSVVRRLFSARRASSCETCCERGLSLRATG
jgi:hypothetical protein